ncbi:G2/mitotic-specific cyclin-B2-like isoform X2 [Wyeomyia smithii]|uniref:G2/mitotic-specific cyclin-B2-like isoform X2 n=1 Tax=Wyeomyia smithii TaxID=174621 RepID=UPI002467BE8E|nr:G2/mitotic-specific cyclin-B2-like isoform X2 [Wyeomyia smithii]
MVGLDIDEGITSVLEIKATVTTIAANDQNAEKRKTEDSMPKNDVKRLAFGDVTNDALFRQTQNDVHRATLKDSIDSKVALLAATQWIMNSDAIILREPVPHQERDNQLTGKSDAFKPHPNVLQTLPMETSSQQQHVDTNSFEASTNEESNCADCTLKSELSGLEENIVKSDNCSDDRKVSNTTASAVDLLTKPEQSEDTNKEIFTKNDKGVKRLAFGDVTNDAPFHQTQSNVHKATLKDSIESKVGLLAATQRKTNSDAIILREQVPEQKCDNELTTATSTQQTYVDTNPFEASTDVKLNYADCTLKSELSGLVNNIVKSDKGFDNEKLSITTANAVDLLIKPEQSEGTNKEIPTKKNLTSPIEKIPKIYDFDQRYRNHVHLVPNYAFEIFEYLKDREKHFIIPDYMTKQPYILEWTRAMLVDWMVDVIEQFELYHETLYLAVKIVDIYLSRAIIEKEYMQLLGATALFVASKYEEHRPLLSNDLHYICDDAFERYDLILMEIKVLNTIGHELGIPISYRFLRRYALAGRVSLPVLTLARYILESALMYYGFIQLSDSKMACAALFIAMRMNNLPGWNKTLEHYTGYKTGDFAMIIVRLNQVLLKKPVERPSRIRCKYSKKELFEVAKKAPITDLSKLFEMTGFGIKLSSDISSAIGTPPDIEASPAATTAV